MNTPAQKDVARTGSSLRLGAFRLEPSRGLFGPDEAEVPLRPKTLDLLRYLARHAGRVVSRDELMDAVWPGLHVTDDSITQYVTEIRRALGPDGAAILRTLARRGYLLDLEAVKAPAAFPVLAVLPFDNLSGEPRWARLCDGLCEDLITDLAREPDLRVIARTSSFAWRGRAADMREIGRALGARYLLEGSVQAEGGRIAVTAQLIEAESGEHVWAHRFHRAEEALFDIQAEIVGRVVAMVAGSSGAIARTELARARRRPPASLGAYEVYRLGWELEARLDAESVLHSLGLLRQALAMDPLLSPAWTTLGFALGLVASNGWAEDIAAIRAEQDVAIRRAAELDPGDGLAQEELGAMLARHGDIAGAREAFERAAEAGPNHADTLALVAKYVAEVLGQPERAVTLMERAYALNPYAPAWYRLGQVRVAYFAGDFEGTVEAVARAPRMRVPRLFGLLALARLGRRDEAVTALAEDRREFGEGGAAAVIAVLPPLCPAARESLAEGLRAAGLVDLAKDVVTRSGA